MEMSSKTVSHNCNVVKVTSVVVLFVFMSWCLKNFLCCWRLMYVFIFLVKLR